MSRLAPLLLLAVPVLAQEDAAPPNFADHVEPILREHCFACHRGSRARNGLDLRSVRRIRKGGSSGAAVSPGDPEGSLLFQVIARTREPYMPPDEPPLEPELLAVIEAWIAGGARATAEDQGAAAEPAGPTYVPPPKVGTAVLPAGVPTQPVWWSERADTITALAASPTAPLVAVGGHRQVALYSVPGAELLGVLPFPEGEVHGLRFAASGAVLVVAGGRGADRGLAVGFDVAGGERVFELGDEPDVALDADVTVDHRVVALGGPDRVVRAYSARSGELLYALEEHTDWVTAVAFSPDGVLLATGDRAGGVFVWEALTGREFHALPAGVGPVTSLSWRADSMLVAVGGDEGRVETYEMQRGRRVRRFGKHGGVLDLQLLASGDGVSVGRDGRARLWQENGREHRNFPAVRGPATAVCATHDGAFVVVGDFGGNVRAFPADGKQPVATLRANPRTDEERALAAARAALPGLEERVPAAEDALASAREALAAAEEELAGARAATEPVLGRVAPIEGVLEEAEGTLAEAEARLARYTGPQAEKDAVAAEARERARTLDAELDEARRRVDVALTRAVRAEEVVVLAADEGALETLEEARTLAADLLAGASARAQLAASRAAEARVAAEVAEAAAAAWREGAAPALAARDTARTEVEQRRAELERAREEARSVEQAVLEASRARDAAADEVRAAEERLASTRAALESGRVTLRETEAAWQALRAKLAANGGRLAD